MPTDPTGTVFLSYKRKQLETAEALEQSLHEHGVPTWRDVTDLRTEPTVPELRQVLEDPETASGIALVSDDIVESDVILKLELPKFAERVKNDDGFFVVVALAPGIDYSEAETILATSPVAHDLGDWNMKKINDNVGDPQATEDVVQAVLKRRLQEIHRATPPQRPIECSLDTYEAPAYDPKPAIAVDWSAHFREEHPSQPVWDERLVPALTTVTDHLNQHMIGRSVRFRGSAHLPAAFALGHRLPTTRRLQATWMQQNPADGSYEPWDLGTETEPSGLEAEYTEKDVSASDLAVLVNISDEVRNEFGRTKSRLPNFNGVLDLSLTEERRTHLSPPQAAHAAEVFKEAVRDALNHPWKTSTIHLFMAIPAGLAFLFGQQSNTLPPLQTYLLNTEERKYEPSALLK